MLLALVKPLGWYMARVYEGQPCGLTACFGLVERVLYRLRHARPTQEMTWKQYAVAMLLFNLLGLLVVYGLQRLQHAAAAQSAGAARAVTPDSSFNTAVSFATNTNWQGYGGETTMSYLTQMLGLTVQNFVSAATGMAVLVALIRGFARAATADDRQLLGRSDAQHALHPAAAVAGAGAGAGLAGRGAELSRRIRRCTLLAADRRMPTATPSPSRRLPLGPAASQIAIKQLGTNGGGFFNVNSAHPFENPTPLSNFLEMLAILLIPAALCYTFGEMVGDTRQGWAMLAAMLVIFVPLLAAVLSRRSRRAIPRSRRWASIRRASDAAVRRQHGRQGSPLRHRQLGAVGDGDHRRLQRQRQLDARFVTRRWAAWCRCG